jgi:hypothetical protein
MTCWPASYFVQFLFHRKDSKGRPALDAARLNRLYEDGVLSARYDKLAQILENYDDSYALFQWLNNKFNGDLFPGKAEGEDERQAEWLREKDNVRPEHLNLLADFISGRVDLGSGQMSLWQHYSFDAIPIEFISSIYETFVGNPGIFSDRRTLEPECLDYYAWVCLERLRSILGRSAVTYRHFPGR